MAIVWLGVAMAPARWCRPTVGPDLPAGSAAQPPVTLIWRLTAGPVLRRSMMKSWPFGLPSLAGDGIIALVRRPPARAEIGIVILSKAQQSLPVHVTRTRLQLSQKLWVSGVMKPSF